MVSEVYEAFRSAGVSEEKARDAASAIPVGERLATKDDIAEVRAEIAEVRAELKGDIAEVRAELKGDIAEVRAEVAGVKTELKGDIAGVKTELKGDIADLKKDIAILKFVYGPVIIGLLVKLVFFPG